MIDHAAGFDTFVRNLSLISADPRRVADLYECFGEFCHTLRNRLQSLNLSLYIARRNGSVPAEVYTRVEGYYQKLERLVDQLQWTCRPAELQPMSLPLGMLVEERRGVWDARFAARDCRVVIVEAVDEVAGWFDPSRLGLALDALTLWRAAVLAPGSTVEIGWRARRGQFQLDWSESGEPTDESPDDPGGNESLALAMLGRVMADHHGILSLSEEMNFALSLRWAAQTVFHPESRPACTSLTGWTGRP